mgnify:CR=1 FL=1
MKLKFLILSMFCLIGFAACDSDNNDLIQEENPDGHYKYIFVAYSAGSQGVESTPYIISSNSVSGGTVDLSKGIETDAYSFIVQNNTLFSAVWGSSQGPITPYKLNSTGALEQIGNKINAPVAAVYGTVNDNEWIGGGFTGSAQSPNAPIFRVDAVNLKLASSTSIDVTPLAIDNEWPSWHGVFQVDNDKLFIPYVTSPQNGDSKHRDRSNILIVNYPSLTYKAIIHDTRTGELGNWFGMQGLKQIEDGDVYAWSPAAGVDNPSAFIRIKKGTEVFDQDYFFNVEEKSGGLKLSRAEYLGGYKFLTSFFVNAEQVDQWNGRTKLAIVNVQSKSITWVAGVPEHPQMSYKQKIYVEDDKKTVHYVMKDDNNKLFVYNIDIESAQGAKGLEIINAADVTTISKLTY